MYIHTSNPPPIPNAKRSLYPVYRRDILKRQNETALDAWYGFSHSVSFVYSFFESSRLAAGIVPMRFRISYLEGDAGPHRLSRMK